MRLLLIGCGLLVRELSDAITHSPHLIDARYLPAALHDSGAKSMRRRLQQEIDSVDVSGYDAIVLGYGLCGMGVAGLKAPAVPLVVPRAHDCITLLMGSREEYARYFNANPGTYYRSVGWMERGREIHEQLMSGGVSQDRDYLISRYGEEAGQYLYEEATRYRSNYRRLTYIRTGSKFDDFFAGQARAEAHQKNWASEEFQGSMELFRRLLAGDWQSDFLVVQPGHSIAAAWDANILRSDTNAPTPSIRG